MFKIYDGRAFFYQWDLNRKLIVEDSSVKEVHFCNRSEDCSLVCEVYVENGINLVNVPNVLLQKSFAINVYAFDGEHTKHSTLYRVLPRSKPADYVYTETEVKSWERLREYIEAATSPEAIEKAVGEWTITANDIVELDYETTYKDSDIYNANAVNVAIAAVAGALEDTYEQIGEVENRVIELAANKTDESKFSNALINSVNGELVVIDDISPTNTKAKVSCSSFFLGTKIIRCGKNIFNGVTKDAEGLNPEVYRRIEMYLPKGTYTLSSNIMLYFQKKSDTLNWVQAADKKSCKLSVSESGTYFINIRDGKSSSTTWSNENVIQIEVGEYSTEFETYKGEELELKSELEIQLTTDINTVYITDNNSAITVEYNKDINKAYAELQQAIISLGGNV